jgi:hypothetical protein
MDHGVLWIMESYGSWSLMDHGVLWIMESYAMPRASHYMPQLLVIVC